MSKLCSSASVRLLGFQLKGEKKKSKVFGLLVMYFYLAMNTEDAQYIYDYEMLLMAF